MLEINRQTLLKELQFVGVASEQRSVIPSLSTVKVEAASGQIFLTTSNLDLTAKTLLSAEKEESEGFCVSHLNLFNALKNASSETVLITKEKAKIEIICGKTKFKLPIMETDVFPETPVFTPESEIEIKASILKNALKLTGFACGENLRQNLSGVFFKNNGSLNVWALDGNICSFTTCKEKVSDTEFDFVIPEKSIRGFISLCDETDTLKLQIEKNHVALVCGDKSLITRKLLTESPNIKMIQTDKSEPTFVFQNKNLLSAIRASQSLDELVTKADGRFSSLAFEYSGKNEINLASVGGDSGFESAFEAEEVKNFELFKLNSFYLQKFLLANEKESEITAKLYQKRFNAFIETEDFECEFIQQTLTF